MKPIFAIVALIACVPALAQRPFHPSANELLDGYRRADTVGRRSANSVFKISLEPHWFGSGRFWYRNNLKDRRKEFVLVDASSGEKRPAFDHAKLAAALSDLRHEKIEADRLPFDGIVPSDDLASMRFSIGDQRYQLDLSSYALTTPASATSSSKPEASEAGPGSSPDGNLRARVHDGQIEIRPKGGAWFVITKAGLYSDLTWAEDSQHVLAFRQLPGDHKKVYLLHATGPGKTRATLQERLYDQPGDKMDAYEPYVLDVQAKTEKKVAVAPIMGGSYPWPGAPDVRPQWGAFYLTFPIRGFQRYEVVRVDPATASAKTLVDETFSTFVDIGRVLFSPLGKTHEFLWRSERDGWARLYLIDGDTGEVKSAVTPTGGVFREVQFLDEDKRELWFSASGLAEGQDPYHVHFYRVKLDGSGLVKLTQGDGTHTVAFSPDRQYYVDTYSRVDLAPVHELHRSSDGASVATLEKGDIGGLLKNGVHLPERFVAKGRDGLTDIWGFVVKPTNFDPHKKYPVVEDIYAGPQDSFVPKAFRPVYWHQGLAELGFIVVQIDGMGTANRGKKFHDVCYKNIADAGFPDRILWMQALAKHMPQADISRVGVYGTSAGGQNAAGAVLFHPEFYKAAVAACGCHDNRIDKQWWNEQWMGYPVGPHYEQQSNITNAGKLKGHLMLIVGEDDTNVPPETTIRFADALIRARKDFDYVLIPGADHTDGGPFGEHKRRDFFVRWLLGAEPPEWPVPPAAGK